MSAPVSLGFILLKLLCVRFMPDFYYLRCCEGIVASVKSLNTFMKCSGQTGQYESKMYWLEPCFIQKISVEEIAAGIL